MQSSWTVGRARTPAAIAARAEVARALHLINTRVMESEIRISIFRQGEGKGRRLAKGRQGTENCTRLERLARQAKQEAIAVKCHQCDNNAIYLVGQGDSRIPLCLHCYEKMQAMNEQRARMLMAERNRLIGEMELISGVNGLPRYAIPEPRPQIHQGNLTMNNIQVNGVNNGVINMGEIQRVDLAVGHLRATQDDGFAAALENFTQAVLDSKDLSNEQKAQLIEQLSVVGLEATKPTEARRKGVLGPVLAAIKDMAQTAASLATTWAVLAPYVSKLLG